MEKFLNWTAWIVEPPKAYGVFHILYTLIGFTFSWILAGKLKNIDEKKNKILLFSVGMYLLLSEIYKQLFFYYVIGHKTPQLWIIPFQLCSIPMYFCLLIPFMKNEKLKNSMYYFMSTFNLMGGFIAFFEPSGIFNSHLTIMIHSLLWHMILVFLGFYLVRSKRTPSNLYEFTLAVKTFIVLIAIAFLLNILLSKATNGGINMFFIGPPISPLIVFHDIAEKFGWYINAPIYIFAVCLGAFIFYYFFHYIDEKHKIIDSTKNKLKKGV